MSCILLISTLDCFMMVAVMGKRPHEVLSPQGTFSEPWRSLSSVSGQCFWVFFQTKLRAAGGLISSFPPQMPWILHFLHLYKMFSWNENTLSIATIFLSAKLQIPGLLFAKKTPAISVHRNSVHSSQEDYSSICLLLPHMTSLEVFFWYLFILLRKNILG